MTAGERKSERESRGGAADEKRRRAGREGDAEAPSSARSGDGAGAAGEADVGAPEAGSGADHTTDELEAETEEMLERLRQELEELEAVRDRHLRLAAEFDNYRRRTREELSKTRQIAQAELTGRLLDALDDLARVSSTPADTTSVEALQEGVELVERKLLKELKDAGLEPIAAEGEPFDPTFHEALVTSPTDDPEEDERVGRVFVTGYRFGDRLLRPARVEVRKYADRREEGAGGTGEPDGHGS